MLIYVLDVKMTFQEVEQWKSLNYIWQDVNEVEDKERSMVVVSSSAEADIVITRLTQPKRLERELRKLDLSRTVLIFRSYDLNMLSAKTIVLSSGRAWCTYVPTVQGMETTQADLRSLPGYMYAIAEPQSEQETIEGPDRPTGSLSVMRTYPICSKPERSRPVLFRHESTGDPSARNYHEITTSRANSKYACQRRAPLVPINDALVKELELMKLARILQGDSIGERAYATTIASIRSYDKAIEHASEIANLEGCGRKIVSMVQEFLDTDKIQEVISVWEDEDMRILRTFWNCHGVGAATAREWFYTRGYRDLNDAIQDWDGLPRAVQIGLKHYEDFLQKLERSEVEYIANVVIEGARKVAVNAGSLSDISAQICGGYRRGKPASGDVDLLLTHETIHGYNDMLLPLLHQLESLGFVETIISAHHERDASKREDSGVCTALLVVLPSAPFANIRRRLDIILCTPQSYITAILGWTGSTTLERDLRRYCSVEKGLTFDSTAISDEVTKCVIDIPEINWTPGSDVLMLEKKLFAFLDLEWIEPEFRNVG